jgi:prefoldin subunit 5
MSEQVFTVKTVYEVADKTSKPLDEIAKTAHKTHGVIEKLKHQVEHLKESFEGMKKVAETVGVAFLAEKAVEYAKEAFIEYNSELEEHTLILAGLTSAYTGMSIEKSWDRATESLKKYTDQSWESDVPAQELMKVAGQIQGPMLEAGKTIRQVENMTKDLIEVGEVYGVGSGEIGEHIVRAITMGARKRDAFMRGLLSQKSIGVSIEDFNKKTQAERADILEKAINSKEMKGVMEKKDETFSNAWGTIKSQMTNLFADVSQPLFHAITEELKEWGHWINNNRQKLEEIAKTVGEGLVTGMRALKDVFKFIYDHSGVLLEIAKVYAAVKIGSIAGKALGGITSFVGEGGIGKTVGKFLLGGIGKGDLFTSLTYVGAKIQKDGTMVSSAFGRISAAAGPVIAAFAGGYAIGTAIRNWLHKDDAEHARNKNTSEGFLTALNDGDELNRRQRWNIARNAAHEGLLYKNKFSKGYSVDQERLAEGAGRGDEYRAYKSAGIEYVKSLQENTAEMKLLKYSQEMGLAELSNAIGIARGSAANAMIDAGAAKIQAQWDKLDGFQAKPPQQNVTINIQQVTAKDPNRWLAEMDDMVARRTRAKTRAKNAWRTSPK